MSRIENFSFQKGTLLADKYEVVKMVGSGWEGEVYLVRELGVDVDRAAKLYFPHRDRNGDKSRFSARKQHNLRDCGILIHFHTYELLAWQGEEIKMLVSEYVEGMMLEDYVKKQRGKRMPYFEALHLLRTLAQGVAAIHEKNEYHGDIHAANVVISRKGAWFNAKIFDPYDYGKVTKELIAGDVVDLILLFHEVIGGQKWYRKHPPWVKKICCGLKHTVINKKWKNAGQLLKYIDTFEWE